MKELIEEMWQTFDDYKATAEQHMFPAIALFDIPMTRMYEDLKKNYTEEHAELFIKNMKFVFKTLDIPYDEDI